ncbi:MAG: hypothetical protein HRT45_05785 [Bdellovibrionales bacterium]|nr:hypothetical protein [Bdellovibrionales bacterium]
MIKSSWASLCVALLAVIALTQSCGRFQSQTAQPGQESTSSSRTDAFQPLLMSKFDAPLELADIAEISEQLTQIPSNDIRRVTLTRTLHAKSALFAIYVKANSCDQLFSQNPHMPTGEYTLYQGDASSLWVCEVNNGQVTGSRSTSLPDRGNMNCVSSGICVGAPKALMLDNFDKRVEGSSRNETFNGTPGKDKILGKGGNDTINGGQDGDHLEGNEGNDTLNGDMGEDVLLGGPGDDIVRGGRHNDFVGGGEGDDRLFGEHGNDYLRGGAGNDFLAGGDGRDYLQGGENRDILYGGGGSDLLEGNEGNDDIHAGEGDDFTFGGKGADLIYGEDGNDRLAGNLGHDRIHGGSGDDIIWGNEGSDLLDGGPGEDYLAGNDGSDVLHGGPGNDVLIGHMGSDVYVFNPGSGLDSVLEFEGGIDRIDIRTFNLKSLNAIKNRTTCFGEWTGDVNTADDYCIIHLSNTDKTAILSSPGISAVLAEFSNIENIFIFKMSDAEKKDREFLIEVYDKYFGRPPQLQAYFYWLEQMVENENDNEIERDILFGASLEDQDHVLQNTADAARQFLTDNNFGFPAWLTLGETGVSEDLLNRIYRKYFERDIAGAGLDYWLEEGKSMSTPELEKSIIYGSRDSDRSTLAWKNAVKARTFLREQSFELPEWLTVAKENERKAAVRPWYQKYFKRDADGDGVQYWQAQLTVLEPIEAERDFVKGTSDNDKARMKNQGTDAVARLFFSSNSFTLPDWLACLPGELMNSQGECEVGEQKQGRIDYLSNIYQEFFNRPADAEAINYWEPQLATNPWSNIKVLIIKGAINQAPHQDRTYMVQNKAVEARRFLRSKNSNIPDWLDCQSPDRAANNQGVCVLNSDATARRDFIKSLYSKYLNRTVGNNASGLVWWVEETRGKTTLVIERDFINGITTQADRTTARTGNSGNQAREFLNDNDFAIPAWLQYSSDLIMNSNGECVVNQARLDRIAYLSNIYQEFFNRPADTESVNFWEPKLATNPWVNIKVLIIKGAINQAPHQDRTYMVQNKAVPARRFLKGQTSSLPTWLQCQEPDKVSNNNGVCVLNADAISRRDFLKTLYTKYLNRTVTNNDSGLIYWVEDTRGLKRTRMETNFIFGITSSADRNTVLNSTADDKARKHLYDANWSVPGWLRCEENYVVNRNNGRCEMDAEYSANRDFIVGLYDKYFSKTPDEAGIDYWMGRLPNYSRVNLEFNFINGASGADRRTLREQNVKTALRFIHNNNKGSQIPSWLLPY